jgi:hypothetical protein
MCFIRECPDCFCSYEVTSMNCDCPLPVAEYARRKRRIDFWKRMDAQLPKPERWPRLPQCVPAPPVSWPWILIQKAPISLLFLRVVKLWNKLSGFSFAYFGEQSGAGISR